MVNIKDIRALLSENPFFDGMSNGHLETMAGCGRLAHFKAGEFLLHEGSKADTFYLIRDGEVVHVRGYGRVSENGAAVDADTLFSVGSVSKVVNLYVTLSCLYLIVSSATSSNWN